MEINNDFPEYKQIYSHGGEDYRKVLTEIHEVYRPKRYLEIGVNTSETLKLATCGAVGVDPNLQLRNEVVGIKPFLHLFQETSDDFFKNHDFRSLTGGPIDVAFLDGLHLAEYLLRDFINTEVQCSNNSLIILHDCLPIDIFCTRREQFDADIRAKTPSPATWTGDVWKTLAALRLYRPDLKISCLDAPPTGLVLVSNTDPKSNILKKNYSAVVKWFDTIETTSGSIKSFLEDQNISSTKNLQALLENIR